MTKISARKVGSRDVRWSKFVGTGKERNAFFPVSFPFQLFPVPFHAHLYNPPWSLLPRLVNFLTHRPRVEAVVIGPEWPQAMWFRPLQDLSFTSVLLPRQHEMFVPGHPGLPRILQPPRWDLRAFHVTPR